LTVIRRAIEVKENGIDRRYADSHTHDFWTYKTVSQGRVRQA